MDIFVSLSKMCTLESVLPSKMWPDQKDFNFRYDVFPLHQDSCLWFNMQMIWFICLHQEVCFSPQILIKTPEF